eukprot:6458264-Pyramimonas_sp.AAC.1
MNPRWQEGTRSRAGRTARLIVADMSLTSQFLRPRTRTLSGARSQPPGCSSASATFFGKTI